MSSNYKIGIIYGTNTTEIVISMVVEKAFQSQQQSQPLLNQRPLLK